MAQGKLFHLGYIVTTDEFVLWKQGRNTEVVRIPRTDMLAMMETVLHVENVRNGNPD